MFKHLSFYKTHSHFTACDTNEFSFLEEMPNNPFELFDVVQNLVIHETECQWGNYQFAKARYSEANLRHSADMFRQIKNITQNKVFDTQPLEKKLICNCRGASLLFLSLLRSKKIPARLRVGFVTYHPIANFNIDHVIVEFYDHKTAKTYWADVLVTETFKQKNKKNIVLDATNIQKDQFIPAERAWLSVRSNRETPESYGIGLFKNRKGLFTIRNKLLHELCARLKIEMLPGDLWGYMLLEGPSADPTDSIQISKLDEIANLLIADDITRLTHLYQNNPALKVPSIVINHSGLDGIKAIELGEISCLSA